VDIVFSMPSNTDVPDGLVQLTMIASYGTTGKAFSKRVSRSVSTTYRYIRPVTGIIQVEESYPPSCVASECPSTSVWVKLSNFPYYELQPPYDLTVLAVFIGTSRCNVSEIQSSTALFTSITILLPPNKTDIPSGYNATVTVIYKPFGSFILRCAKLLRGLCADRAATFTLPILSDPSPSLLALFPTEIQKISPKKDRLVSVKVAYLPKQISLADLDARIVNRPDSRGSGFGLTVAFVTDSGLLVQPNPLDLAPSCTRESCSLVELVVLAPDLLPAGMSNEVILQICLVSKMQCVQGGLTFVEYVVTEYPPSVQVTPGLEVTVEIYIVGFEYHSSRSCTFLVNCEQTVNCSTACPCNCGQLQLNCLPSSLCSVQPSVISFQNGPIFQAKIQVPTAMRLGPVPMMLSNLASGAQAPFSITYLQPPPLVIPVDYPLGGTTEITVTAYWGLVTKPVLVIFPGGNRRYAPSDGTDLYSSYSVIRFTPPIAASRSAGTVSVTLQAATGLLETVNAVQVFQLHFFSPPVVQALEPVLVSHLCTDLHYC
jgi:hypothetical protein